MFLCGVYLALPTCQCSWPTRKIQHFIEPPSPCHIPPKRKNPTPSMNMVDLQAKYNKMNNTIPKRYKYIISKWIRTAFWWYLQSNFFIEINLEKPLFVFISQQQFTKEKDVVYNKLYKKWQIYIYMYIYIYIYTYSEDSYI